MSQALTPPPAGAMYLFDYVTPPLMPGSYRVEASTRVHASGINETLSQTRHFDVVGPRFALSPADVGGVFPPRNARGSFEGTLPHIAIKRRTFPWERRIAAALPRPAASAQPPEYPVPWVALLLFDDGEYTLLEDLPLENVVPPSVFDALGRPEGIRVTAVEADTELVRSLMPSIEELQLLTHVRWVNKDDRELSVEGSDGWFSVVMGNRLPVRGAKCRACLVSLEQRPELIPVDAPGSISPPRDGRFPRPPSGVLDAEMLPDDTRRRRAGDPRNVRAQIVGGVIDPSNYVVDGEAGQLVIGPRVRLVVLDSWQFTCEGAGTFRHLMENLDVGMIGKPDKTSQPQLTDTGHLRLRLVDRAGVEESVWYRGPLVQYELTRDTQGPYHSADQARRVAPDTGAEDVSYAAAFEVGRLLAAADGRLAQELMRWRREAFRQSGRTDVLAELQQNFPLGITAQPIEELHKTLTPVLTASVVEKIVDARVPIADPTGLERAGPVVGLDPDVVRDVWRLGSVDEARVLLGDPGALGVEAVVPEFTAPVVASLDDLAGDPRRLEHLEAERDVLVRHVVERLED